MNWLARLRESKEKKPANIVIEYDWDRGSIHFIGGNPHCEFSTDPAIIKRQVGFIASLEKIKRKYLDALKANYGNDMEESAKAYADAYAVDDEDKMGTSAVKIRSIADKAVEKELAEEDTTVRILIDEELNNICKEG